MRRDCLCSIKVGAKQMPGGFVSGNIVRQHGERSPAGLNDTIHGGVVGGKKQGVAIGEVSIDGAYRDAGHRRQARRRHGGGALLEHQRFG